MTLNVIEGLIILVDGCGIISLLFSDLITTLTYVLMDNLALVFPNIKMLDSVRKKTINSRHFFSIEYENRIKTLLKMIQKIV